MASLPWKGDTLHCCVLLGLAFHGGSSNGCDEVLSQTLVHAMLCHNVCQVWEGWGLVPAMWCRTLQAPLCNHCCALVGVWGLQTAIAQEDYGVLMEVVFTCIRALSSCASGHALCLDCLLPCSHQCTKQVVEGELATMLRCSDCSSVHIISASLRVP
jgi:hypothetical protein